MKLAIYFSFALAIADAQVHPILTATTAIPSSKLAVPINGLEENLKPFDVPAGYTISKIVDRFTLNATGVLPIGFGNWDMVAFAAPENTVPGLFPDGGRYVFIPFETGAGGILRYDLAYGTYMIIAQSNPLISNPNPALARNPNPATFDVNNDVFPAPDEPIIAVVWVFGTSPQTLESSVRSGLLPIRVYKIR